MSSNLVCRHAPDFTVSAVQANGEIIERFNFSEATRDKYAMLFFYPLDFTFVCPTELVALNARIDDFTARNVEVIGISIDSQFTHSAWRQTSLSEGGIGALKFTLAADVAHNVCRAYGVEHPTAGVALRATFIINKEGIVMSQIVNNLPIGRNVDELLRIIDAMQYTEVHGEVCPANWHQGDAAMRPDAEGVASYLKSIENQD